MLNFIAIFHNPWFPIGFDILKVIENSSIILNIIYIDRDQALNKPMGLYLKKILITYEIETNHYATYKINNLYILYIKCYI